MVEKNTASGNQGRGEVPGKKPKDRAAIAVKSFVTAKDLLGQDPAVDIIRDLKRKHKMANYNPKKHRWECGYCGKHGRRSYDARDLANLVCTRRK